MRKELDEIGESLVDLFLNYGWIIPVVVIGAGIFFTVGNIDSDSEVENAMDRAENITDSDFCERTSSEYVGTPRINCYQNRTLQNTTIYTNPVTFDVLVENDEFELRVVN